MNVLTIKIFNNLKFGQLLLILSIFYLVFQIALEAIELHLINNYMFSFKKFLIGYVIGIFNLIFVSLFLLWVFRLLNKKIDYFKLKTYIRVLIDCAVFFIIINGWIILINFLMEGTLSSKKITFLLGIGTIINLFLIPFFEFIVFMHKEFNARLLNEQLQKINSKYKFEVLKNQINPHFLFNNLSVLNSLIGRDVNYAKKFTLYLSQVYRYVLDVKDVDSITLEEEKRFIERYIFMLKTRFSENIIFNLDIKQEYFHQLIIPMSMQILIENVIKHNKVIFSKKLIVKIEANKKGITLSNNLVPKSSISSWGIGIGNLKKRYSAYGKELYIVKNELEYSITLPYL